MEREKGFILVILLFSVEIKYEIYEMNLEMKKMCFIFRIKIRVEIVISGFLKVFGCKYYISEIFKVAIMKDYTARKLNYNQRTWQKPCKFSFRVIDLMKHKVS